MRKQNSIFREVNVPQSSHLKYYYKFIYDESHQKTILLGLKYLFSFFQRKKKFKKTDTHY